MENLIKMILLAVAIDVTAVVLSVAIFVTKAGSSGLEEYSTRISDVLFSGQGPEFASLSGQYVDGKTVRSMMEQYGGQYLIRVKTKRNPVSFAVYTQPVNHNVVVKFADANGTGQCEDYSDPDSFYYVNSNVEFMTSTISSDGEVVGVCFTEKGAGVASAELKASDYWVDSDSDGDVTIEDAKDNYAMEVTQAANSFDVAWITNAKNTADAAIADLEDQIEENRSTQFADIDLTKLAEYNAAKSAKDTAEEAANQAWFDLTDAFQSVSGSEVLVTGHADVTYNDSSYNLNDTANLQYWINKIGDD